MIQSLRAMSDDAKRRYIVRRLLELTDEHGRGYYPLAPLADDLGVTVEALYDNNTNTGLLWDLGRHGNALIDVLPHSFTSACVVRDNEREAERFAEEPRPAREPQTSTAESTDDLWDQALAGIAGPWHRKMADYEATLRAIAENPGWDDHHRRAAGALKRWAVAG